MSPNPFVPTFARLPADIPVFPLTGALLLPRGRLPLNIFEPRYLAMVEDALAADRIIGMIQPKGVEGTEDPPLFDLGCAGRITSFVETDDGRFLITLTGLCRFRVREEVAGRRGYRRAAPDWSPFRDDLVEEPCGALDRARLTGRLKSYFCHTGIQADWEAIAKTPDERLVTILSMICPFEPGEKQALLEAPDLARRAELLLALIDMALHDMPGGLAGGEMAKH